MLVRSFCRLRLRLQRLDLAAHCGIRADFGRARCAKPLTINATEVDHILGADLDPGHTRLRSVCSSCHKQRTAQQGGGFRQQRSGPPDPPHTSRTQW